MRYLVSLVVIALCNLTVQSLPLPAGQFVQYSVSSKYFNKNNSTSNSLYDILSQIHYGGKIESSTKLTQPQLDEATEVSTISSDNEKEDVKNSETTVVSMEIDTTGSNESQEEPAATTAVIEEQTAHHQQLEKDTTVKDTSSDNDEIINALIEQVVNEQLEKLANTEIKIILPSGQKDVIEKVDLVDDSIATSNTEKANDESDRVSETTMDIKTEKAAEIETTTEAIPAMSVIESDSESGSENVPTNQPDTTTNMETILADNVEHQHQQEEITESNEQEDPVENEKLSSAEATDNKYEIPESLVGAIGDLLSSVLGIPQNSVKAPASDSDDEDVQSTTLSPAEEEAGATEIDVSEQSTEDELSTSTAALELDETKGENDEKTEQTTIHSDAPQSMPATSNEIDLKIENLANVQDTSFMTENTPEVYTETVKEPSTDETDKNKDDVLEALPALTAEEEAMKPDSFKESVNHIMNLIRESEENRLALENAENVVDSILIDHKAINDNVNQILDGALKEIETNFGMSEVDKEIEIPSHAIDVLDREREEMIRNFETDINESLSSSNTEEDQDDFMPNMAKAALYHHFQYGDDFLRK